MSSECQGRRPPRFRNRLPARAQSGRGAGLPILVLGGSKRGGGGELRFDLERRRQAVDVLLSRSGEGPLIGVVRAKVVRPRAVGSVRSGRGPSAEGARCSSSRAAV